MQIKLCLVIAMLISAIPTFANPQNRPATFEVSGNRALVTILSYNVKGLPNVAGVTEDRYADIGLELKKMREQNRQPTVVLLQEAFVSKTKDIDKNAGYKNIAKGPGAIGRNEKSFPVFKVLNAGLRILSEYPIIKEAKVSYNQFMCSSWDCFANKGVQAVQVQIPQVPFPLIIANTHTQAAEGYDDIRVKQFDVFWRFLTKFAGNNEPLFAIGDFNSFPSRVCYKHWCQETKMLSVSDACLQQEVDCNVTLRENKGLEFNPDQHFYRSGKINGYDVTIHPLYAEHLFSTQVNGRFLSDHWGYNVTYEIKWEPAHALASSTH